MPRSVWIAGIHRSGTSAVAGICHHLGVDMGPQLGDLGKNPANPKGQFEDIQMVRGINAMCGSWRQPSFIEPGMHTLHAAQQYINERDAAGTLWGVKSPQLCIVGKYLIKVANDPVLLVTTRDFEASCKSLAERDKFPYACAQVLQAQYWFGLYDFYAYVTARLKIPTFSIAYENLLTSPAEYVDRIAKLLGVEPTQAAYDFIDPSLNHHA